MIKNLIFSLFLLLNCCLAGLVQSSIQDFTKAAYVLEKEEAQVFKAMRGAEPAALSLARSNKARAVEEALTQFDEFDKLQEKIKAELLILRVVRHDLHQADDAKQVVAAMEKIARNGRRLQELADLMADKLKDYQGLLQKVSDMDISAAKHK